MDRNTPMLLPADLRDWVPEDDLVHFVIEAVRTLPTGQLTVQAMKSGAAEFLTKPFREQELLDAIHGAIDSDRASRLRRAQLVDLRRQYESLTPREREVMARVVRGMPNKQNAGAIGTAEKTVKVHRGHIMQKMDAKSLAELVQMSQRLLG